MNILFAASFKSTYLSKDGELSVVGLDEAASSERKRCPYSLDARAMFI